MVTIELNNAHKSNFEAASSISRIYISKAIKEKSINIFIDTFFEKLGFNNKQFQTQLLGKIKELNKEDLPQRIPNTTLRFDYFSENFKEFSVNIDFEDDNDVYWVETEFPHSEEMYLIESSDYWFVVWGIYEK